MMRTHSLLLLGLTLAAGSLFAGATPAPTPEPGTIGMIVVGGAGLLWLRHRRNKK